jgi:hypothetical protein
MKATPTEEKVAQPILQETTILITLRERAKPITLLTKKKNIEHPPAMHSALS